MLFNFNEKVILDIDLNNVNLDNNFEKSKTKCRLNVY